MSVHTYQRTVAPDGRFDLGELSREILVDERIKASLAGKFITKASGVDFMVDFTAELSAEDIDILDGVISTYKTDVTNGDIPLAESDTIATTEQGTKDPVVSWVNVSQVQVGVGSVLDSTLSHRINISSPLTADIETSGAEGLDTGSEAADTWYAIFVIASTKGTKAPAALLSASETPTLPSGYNLFRRVGWVRNGAASDLWKFYAVNIADQAVFYDELDVDLRALDSGNATTFTALDLSAFLPPTAYSATLKASFASGLLGVATDGARFRRTGSGLLAADTPYTIKPGVLTEEFAMETQLSIPISDDQKLDYIVDSAANALSLSVQGYRDRV